MPNLLLNHETTAGLSLLSASTAMTAQELPSNAPPATSKAFVAWPDGNEKDSVQPTRRRTSGRALHGLALWMISFSTFAARSLIRTTNTTIISIFLSFHLPVRKITSHAKTIASIKFDFVVINGM